MPFRDRLSRMIKKSGSGSSSGCSDGSSSSSDGHSETSNVSANTSTTTSMPKTPRGLARSYTSAQSSRISKKAAWGLTPGSSTTDVGVLSFSPAPKHNSKRSTKTTVNSYHPSERRLNEGHLRHQEMLGSFTMKFGRKRQCSHGARSDFSGFSPCNSRRGSVDVGRSDGPVDDQEEGPSRQRRMTAASFGRTTEPERISDRDSWAAGVLAFLSMDCDG